MIFRSHLQGHGVTGKCSVRNNLIIKKEMETPRRIITIYTSLHAIGDVIKILLVQEDTHAR